MDREKDEQGTPWPVLPADSVDDLRELIDECEKQAKTGECLAWRGHGLFEWQLESTLDRWLQEVSPDGSDEQWLGREKALLFRFRTEARVYASETERHYLDGDVWTALAFGRHAGLPTRLLDWTQSPWVAAWFACHEDSDADGAIWWFNQQQLDCIIHKLWDKWDVPTRADFYKLEDRPDLTKALRLEERVLEASAFHAGAPPWISKLHYRFPSVRMEAQQSFMTVCGRLRTTHNDALDGLSHGDEISRGRIVISKGIKGDVLSYLKTMNIHAASLKYPGVDIVAQKINADRSI